MLKHNKGTPKKSANGKKGNRPAISWHRQAGKQAEATASAKAIATSSSTSAVAVSAAAATPAPAAPADRVKELHAEKVLAISR